MKKIAFTSIVFALTAAQLSAQEAFTPVRFEFDDASELAEWRLGGFPGGGREIENGSFVMTAPDDAGASSVFDFEHVDLSVETQIRFLEGHPRTDWASINIRDAVLNNGIEGYSASVSSTGELLLARLTPEVGVDPVHQTTASGFDALHADLKMRLVANGSSLDLFAWPATDPMPTSPQLSLEDDQYLQGSFIGLGNTSYSPIGDASPVAFRYLHISPVPEPSTWLLTCAGLITCVLRFRRRTIRPEHT